MVFNTLGALWGIAQTCRTQANLNADYYFKLIRQPVAPIENLSDVYAFGIVYRTGSWLLGYKKLVLDFMNHVHLYGLLPEAHQKVDELCKK